MAQPSKAGLTTKNIKETDHVFENKTYGLIMIRTYIPVCSIYLIQKQHLFKLKVYYILNKSKYLPRL